MNSLPSIIAAVLAVLVAASPAAHAGQIFTPFVQAGTDTHHMACHVINVGSAAIVVRSELIDLLGVVHCGAEEETVQPGRSSGAFCAVGASPPFAYCKFSTPPFTVTGPIPSIRGNLCIGENTTGTCIVSSDAR